jgi:hypothetical protein
VRTGLFSDAAGAALALVARAGVGLRSSVAIIVSFPCLCASVVKIIYLVLP